jgi:hypothetical protein
VAGVHFPALPAADRVHSHAALVAVPGIWMATVQIPPVPSAEATAKIIVRVAAAVVTSIAAAVVVVVGSEGDAHQPWNVLPVSYCCKKVCYRRGIEAVQNVLKTYQDLLFRDY